MELLHRAVGPLATNVYVLGDATTREAIAIDTAIPCLDWVAAELSERRWTLKLIVSTHGHWDHIGDNARLQAWSLDQPAEITEPVGVAPDRAPHAAAPRVSHPRPTAHGALIAVHPLDRDRLLEPRKGFAPFEIPPSVPAVDLAEGGTIRFGSIRLDVLHTPGHTEGSVCLLAPDEGVLFSGDTLFAGGWGRVDLPGGSAEQMVESIGRLASLDAPTTVLPGHGPPTTIGREQPWMRLVADGRRLFA